jgi:hypothetical protein
VGVNSVQQAKALLTDGADLAEQVVVKDFDYRQGAKRKPTGINQWASQGSGTTRKA